MTQSTSSKRGLLRPMHHGGGKMSAFVVLALVVLTLLFLYNVYSNTSMRNDLQDEIEALRAKSHVCSKDKLELEKKLESLTKSSKRKSMKDDEKLRLLKMSNTDLNQQLSSQKERVDQLTQQVNELQEAKTQVETRLAEMKDAVEQQTLKDQLTTQEFQNLTHNYDRLKQNETNLMNMIEQLKAENSALKVQLNEKLAIVETEQAAPTLDSLPSPNLNTKVSENFSDSNNNNNRTVESSSMTSSVAANSKEKLDEQKKSINDSMNNNKVDNDILPAPVLNQPPLVISSQSPVIASSGMDGTNQTTDVQNSLIQPVGPPGPPGSVVSSVPPNGPIVPDMLPNPVAGISDGNNNNILPQKPGTANDNNNGNGNSNGNAGVNPPSDFGGKVPADYDNPQQEKPFPRPDVSLKLNNKENKAKEEYMYEDDTNGNGNINNKNVPHSDGNGNNNNNIPQPNGIGKDDVSKARRR